MRVSKQLSVFLENKPGTLVTLCRDLREAGVNVDALFVTDDTDGTWVHLIATPAGETQHVLTDKGYNFYTEKVLTLRAKNHPGELERIAGQLADSKININYVYGSTANNGAFMLVLHVNDLERAVPLFDD